MAPAGPVNLEYTEVH